MKKEKSSFNGVVRNSIKIAVFVLAIVVFGISVSYAYYSANMKGSTDVSQSYAGTFDVTTTLSSATAINTSRLALIESGTYLNSAEKVSFTVTNQTTSDVKAKYTINLVEMSITKNLSSEYFKWALVFNAGTSTEKTITGNFLDSTNIAPEGTTVDKDSPETVTGLTKALLNDTNAQILDIGSTDAVDFYIWLENDSSLDQLYLTNGAFSAQLSLDAVPSR